MFKSDGTNITVDLSPVDGEGAVRLTAGDRVLYEGSVAGGLKLEVDGRSWGVPDAVLELLSQKLPPVSTYSPNAFAPLATPFVTLSSLNMLAGGETPTWTTQGSIQGQTIPISVLAGSLHYAQSVFEGAKTFFVRHEDGRVEARMFRPRKNARRLWRSARHMGVPLERSDWKGMRLTEDRFADFYEEMTREAVQVNAAGGLFEGAFMPIDRSDPQHSWDATPRSLYLRPILFATGAVLGVKPASHYTFAVYTTPAGRYRSDLVLRVERERARAYPGGTGAVKAACNYAPTLPMMSELVANRARATAETPWKEVYDDILFLSRDGLVEEMGGANFFLLGEEGGQLVLRTPPSTQDSADADTILPGVTRDTVLQLAELLGLVVEVGPIPISRLTELSVADARKTAVFTTGTAAGVAPVVALLDRQGSPEFAVWDDVSDAARRRRLTADHGPPGSALAAGRLLRTVLFRIQLGDEEGLRELIPDRADAILAHVREQNWVQSFFV
ncbi:MAG TPA: hypothetical protein DIU15_18260 [Deltaproteobacteria bacterium]|nr:hypothetical protein [Deltaproteobacteria bacterium]HCP47990.1 hypothetical protein [Deltaproteobacteria bacterium]